MDMYNYLVEEIKKIQEMSDEEVKRTVLEVMSATGTWLGLDELKKFLPLKQFEEVVTHLKTNEEQSIHKRGSEGVNIAKIVESMLELSTFIIKKNENGQFILSVYGPGIIEVELNLEEIEIQNLTLAVKYAMKKHRDYNYFHNGEILNSEQIPKILDSTISGLAVVKDKYIQSLMTRTGNLQEMSDEEVKRTLLEAMSATGTYITLEDLRSFLRQEQYACIENKLKTNVKGYISKHGTKEISDLDDYATSWISDEYYLIERDASGQFKVSVYGGPGGSFVLDLEEIKTQSLINVVEKTMRKHRDYNYFHNGEILNSEQIPEMLDSTISGISNIKRITPENIEQATEDSVTTNDLSDAIGTMRSRDKGENSNNIGIGE